LQARRQRLNRRLVQKQRKEYKHAGQKAKLQKNLRSKLSKKKNSHGRARRAVSAFAFDW
jgi:hypothetical protein